MYEAIVIDTETTDANDPDVVQLAWAHADCGGIRTPVWQRNFKPQRPMAWGALATHHILPSELETCDPCDTVGKHVPKAEYWIGHNVDFDWKALGQPPVKRICTLAMARSIWPKCDAHNLTALTYFLFGVDEEIRERVRGAHDAAADVVLSADILTLIARDEGITSMSEMWGFSEECRIPKIMSFGKFKGQPVGAVDRGWANWYSRQDDIDPYLIQALKRAGKL